MPRKSAASLAVLPVDGRPRPLEPPADLSDEERTAFVSLINTIDTRHFRPSDTALVAAYVRAICFEARAAEELRKDPVNTRWLSLWEKSNRAMVALAGKLRLCPLSRQDPKSAGREQVPGKRPWT